MEIEGIINHNLAALQVKRDALEQDRLFCEAEIMRWNNLRNIHASHDVQEALIGVDTVARLVSSSEHMRYFIAADVTDTFKFKGFDMADIDYYLSLRRFCED